MAVLVLLGPGCTRAVTLTTTSVPPAVSQTKAIAIAGTQVPLQVIERATVSADMVSGWRVIMQGANVTREELNWPDDGKNIFQWEGSANSPPGRFASVAIIVSPSTGEVLQRIATNSIFLGLPPEPTKIVYRGWACSR